MRNISMFLACSLLLWSCSKEIVHDNPTPEVEWVRVTLPVSVSEQEIITRSTDENSIRDVNLYLVSGQNIMHHSFTSESALQFRCPPGKYELHIIANHHADMGDLNVEQLTDYAIKNQGYYYDDLPMTAIEQVEIPATAQAISLPTVRVKRMIAKINYFVTVDPAVSDIEIRSIQVMSSPREFHPFQDLTPDSAPDAYLNGEVIPNKEDPSRTSGSVYLLPNMQGINPEITTPEQKNIHFAPPLATRMRIRAMRENKVLDYTVFLGENDTSDFNVRPNTAHTLHVRILNDNETDVRIQSYTIDVASTIDAIPENGIYLKYAPINLKITLSGRIQNTQLKCELVVKKGNIKHLIVNGIRGSQHASLPILNIPGKNEYPIDYRPTTFAPENVLLTFDLKFSDRYGFVTSFEFSYCFAKVVKVYTKWFDGGKGYGTVSSPDALHSQRGGTLSSEYFLFYCSDAGCKLVATPETNRMLYGWYREHNLDGLISRGKEFPYTPISDYDTIYAYFL